MELFDLVGGLPFHPLIIHLVVVMVPLASLAMTVVIFFPSLRKPFVPLAVGMAVVGAVSSFLAVESGEALMARVGHPGDHQALGERVLPFAVAFALASLIWALVSRGTHPRALWVGRVLGAVVVVLAVLTTTFTVLAGHSGAQTSWEDRISAEALVDERVPLPVVKEAPSDDEIKKQVAEPDDSSPSTFAMEHVEMNDSADSCWTVIDGSVYDVTSWIDQHPGGAKGILSLCGVDGTAHFNSHHAKDQKVAVTREEYLLGSLEVTEP